MNVICPCCGKELALVVSVEAAPTPPPVAPPMVATPAKCLRCNTVYDCPTSGRVLGPCGICGGELRSVAGINGLIAAVLPRAA